MSLSQLFIILRTVGFSCLMFDVTTRKDIRVKKKLKPIGLLINNSDFFVFAISMK